MENHAFFGTPTPRGFIAPFVSDGPIDRNAFETYVEKVLLPELREGDVVIMDNLPSHEGPNVRDLIAAAGARLLYFPPDSPACNPIENAFAKLKARLRKAAERTVEGLWNAIGQPIALVTPHHDDGVRLEVSAHIESGPCGSSGETGAIALSYGNVV